MLDIFRFSVKGFRAKKLRTALSVLGVAVSAASVMIISSLGSTGAQAVNSELDSMGLRGISVSGEQLLGDDSLKLVSSVSGVSAATPVISGYGTVCAENSQRDGVRAYVWGINENADSVISAKIIYGRAVSRADTERQSEVCVLDRKLATELFSVENAVGKSVWLQLESGSALCEVVGICEADSGILKSVSGSLAPYFVYAPYTCVRTAQNLSGFDWMAVQSESKNTDAVCENIRAAFKSEQISVEVENISSQRETLSNMLSIVTLVLTAIAAVSLAVSGLSIMTVMLSSVNERTAEIGIKKAIGAGSKAIMLEFMAEALTISLFGGIIGSAFGAIVSAVAGALMLGAASVDIGSVLLCVLCSAAAGTVFGGYPALKAARLKPVDALCSD